ncbi:hypothetical protein AVENP_0163 [Arcobacter venerupis]|uniref:Uncharacterized protein n=1 Tax=Arcobacter venerupis TaxID=1054033 RepID=A0AAE7B5L6_9BACT|nr:hypothetical protein [Arcobacter venerupis]QKF65743.1 hypothetical protein AVENP_0163 [Arcobacter venerupis]RWS50253.1 hypothetical protein CKA56_04780 [Arcobacter venerupis]
MISISNKTLSRITKICIFVLITYSVGFLIYKTILYFKISFEKDNLTIVLEEKKAQTDNLKKQVELSKKKIEIVEKEYINKEELETKVKDIFSRMSVFDYQLKYLDSKKMCVDRYLIVTQVTAQSENGLQAALGILSYIGKIKKHDQNETIYFVDYISTPKEIK